MFRKQIIFFDPTHMYFFNEAGKQSKYVEKKETDLYEISFKGESNIYEKITFSL